MSTEFWYPQLYVIVNLPQVVVFGPVTICPISFPVDVALQLSQTIPCLQSPTPSPVMSVREQPFPGPSLTHNESILMMGSFKPAADLSSDEKFSL